MLGIIRGCQPGKTLVSFFIAAVLVLGMASCSVSAPSSPIPGVDTTTKTQIKGQISEVAPPEVIQQLSPALDAYQPQVTIISPKEDEILQDNNVEVRFQVEDLPIFKNPSLDLGPHLQVILDNQPYIAVYDIEKPLVLEDVAPGTHTLRVLASRPWDESFKNEGAYAQTTFHIFLKTTDNNPSVAEPLLTYSSPKGIYGAEPILLDFYLTNAPLHLVAQENPDDEIADWRIRVTVNGESFVLDEWQPLYLKGFKPGKNWVRLEFIDRLGNPVKNVFNDTVRAITYQPNGTDILSKLVRGEIPVAVARGIVEPNYTPGQTAPTPTPILEATPPPVLPPMPTVEEPLEQPETSSTNSRSQEPSVSPSPSPTARETVETPTQPTATEAPTATSTQPIEETPATEAPSKIKEPEKPQPGGIFSRGWNVWRERFSRLWNPATSPSPTLPEIVKTPTPELVAPQLPLTPAETTPQPEASVTPAPVAPIEKPTETEPSQLQPSPSSDSFNSLESPAVSPSLQPTLPEILPTPTSEPEPAPELPPATAPLEEKPQSEPTSTQKFPIIEVPAPDVPSSLLEELESDKPAPSAPEPSQAIIEAPPLPDVPSSSIEELAPSSPAPQIPEH